MGYNRTMAQGFLWRLLRTALSLGISTAVAYTTNDIKYIALTPVITATAKLMRDYFNIKNLPL